MVCQNFPVLRQKMARILMPVKHIERGTQYHRTISFKCPHLPYRFAIHCQPLAAKRLRDNLGYLLRRAIGRSISYENFGFHLIYSPFEIVQILILYQALSPGTPSLLSTLKGSFVILRKLISLPLEIPFGLNTSINITMTAIM